MLVYRLLLFKHLIIVRTADELRCLYKSAEFYNRGVSRAQRSGFKIAVSQSLNPPAGCHIVIDARIKWRPITFGHEGSLVEEKGIRDSPFSLSKHDHTLRGLNVNRERLKRAKRAKTKWLIPPPVLFRKCGCRSIYVSNNVNLS
jgi:hypothetical protein